MQKQILIFWQFNPGKSSITGPDAFGAKTSGVIEADFFAQLNPNINLLRLRHAYVKFNWEHLEFLAGQTWNPLFRYRLFSWNCII